jgi:cytochrome c
MHTAKVSGLVIVSALIASCGGGGSSDTTDGASRPQGLTASTLGEQVVLGTAEYLAQPPYDTANRQKGRKLAGLCLACHSIEQGGANMIGPNLYGFFGAPVGSREGYDYSEAVSEADFVWTPRALDAWMAQPGDFLPGNRMTFAGVSKEADRADIIAYLLQSTGEDNETEQGEQ